MECVAAIIKFITSCFSKYPNHYISNKMIYDMYIISIVVGLV